ncbi:PREDICTED: short-chain specific acyl-CoA dehydrogenase, mitochondrial-like [Priapulus caudatus]|uniref:Short-chain specific acyl-CoA dehydrogenase, mitochondrial-like n=1 Tax=Priapulus caudatus TaxID=37621 RepID=A0ABM1F189_PRICU|nr:PREDICTED: short-chain specific acyl-CoA dehydrogenase, mitochondrial-like [Priapulus caudatus]
MAASKQWGRSEYWGLSYAWDLQWQLNDRQKSIQKQLIEVCRTVIRPHAIECDASYIYPRQSMEALAGLGLLGLLVPKSLGGMGENHTTAVMVCETIARYGCSSTAMVYDLKR